MASPIPSVKIVGSPTSKRARKVLRYGLKRTKHRSVLTGSQLLRVTSGLMRTRRPKPISPVHGPAWSTLAFLPAASGSWAPRSVRSTRRWLLSRSMETLSKARTRLRPFCRATRSSTARSTQCSPVMAKSTRSANTAAASSITTGNAPSRIPESHDQPYSPSVRSGRRTYGRPDAHRGRSRRNAGERHVRFCAGRSWRDDLKRAQPACLKRGCSTPCRAHQRRLELQAASGLRRASLVAHHVVQRRTAKRFQGGGVDDQRFTESQKPPRRQGL